MQGIYTYIRETKYVPRVLLLLLLLLLLSLFGMDVHCQRNFMHGTALEPAVNPETDS